ncbi:EAL domain-containing protein [Poseidonibacter sp.]|uniref:EAL domain-containing protein n=1 Tax=Poseidonibacter sp. TaxID=2321188 RepID=UPI003C795D9C
MKSLMNRVLKKYSNVVGRNTLIFFSLLFTMFLFSSYIFFDDFKKESIEVAKKDYALNVDYLQVKLEKYIIENNYKKIEELLNSRFKTNSFKSVNIQLDKFIFNKNTLVENTNQFKQRAWNLGDIVIDAKYGYIQKVKDSMLYEYIPNDRENYEESIPVRFQAYKRSVIKIFLTNLTFKDIKKESLVDSEYKVYEWFDKSIDLENQTIVNDLVYDGVNYGKITYEIDTSFVKSKMYSLFIKLVLFTLVLIVPIFIIIRFYHKLIFARYVNKPIRSLNTYLDKIIENKFEVLDKKEFEGTKELTELTKKVVKISTKVASLVNEVNISKENLERKLSTDTLTGLPNKSVFDFDVKSMFVTSQKATIFTIKLECLGYMSKNHDSNYINAFVDAYTSIIKNVIYKYSKMEITLYRFYGSEFAIIVKDMKLEDIKEMLEEIISQLLNNIPDNYDVPDDLIHIGGTPFDLFGSIDSILESANKAFNISKQNGINTYHIIDESELKDGYDSLHKNVIEIIEEASFDMNFVLDTYSFDEPDKLVMKEAVPLLFDKNNERLAIGPFLSIAEKLNFVDKFDKEVIEKCIKFIKENNIDYEIAINLSMDSLNNSSFMNWLKEYLTQNSDISGNIVFSITSYSAYLNKTLFETFTKEIREYGVKTLIKRYKLEEYPIEQLDGLEVDYIRMHKDYTANFTSDIAKKHKVKNILIYGELNNIDIMSEAVKLDVDYNFLERLGAYATSK